MNNKVENSKKSKKKKINNSLYNSSCGWRSMKYPITLFGS